MAGTKAAAKAAAEAVLKTDEAGWRTITPADAKALNAATPGHRTTEFWVTIVVILAALVLTLADKIGGEVGLGAITAAGGLYSVSRGLAKG
jgi:hypothetical protein